MRSRASLLVVAMLVAGCFEHQFPLVLRDPEHVAVRAPEDVSRLPPVTPDASVFADEGVLLPSGYALHYPRDGDWVVSVEPVGAAPSATELTVRYTVHPGHRDLPLQLTTPTANVCELKTRTRFALGLGVTGLIMGSTFATFAAVGALLNNAQWRNTSPWMGGLGAALVIGGGATMLWPPWGEKSVVVGGCEGT